MCWSHYGPFKIQERDIYYKQIIKIKWPFVPSSLNCSGSREHGFGDKPLSGLESLGCLGGLCRFGAKENHFLEENFVKLSSR